MLAAISVEYLGANAKTLLHKDEHLYHPVDGWRAQQLLRWIVRTGKHAVFARVERAYQVSLTIISSFSSNAFRFFSWSPTEFLASPPQMLKRAFLRLKFWK